jgi:GNAT superfamily N-acetyltransferase
MGTLFINMFYLDARARGQDIGTRAIQMAEGEGRRRGCITVMLMTITIQAPGFYARMGYTKFGEVACLPPGTARVFFTKSLVAA